MALQLLEGLKAAHAAGIVHRDLKPANVMLDEDGRVRITDFGLAGIVDRVHRGDIRSGTPRYMAPESYRDEKCTERIDIYSLAMLMWEMMTGALLGARNL
jgi:serine/threonine-protein kinase